MAAIDYGVVFMDEDMLARLINRAFQDMWNIPDEVMAGRPTMQDLIRVNRHAGIYDVAEEDFDDYVEQRTAAARQGTEHPAELTRADGKTFLYESLTLPDGEVMLTYFDISELKEKERELVDAFEVISTSINYASRIQRSILPNPQIFAGLFSDHFIHWEPRDVVGGDIYWCNTWGDGALIGFAVAG